ncbi:MAG TPA: thioredoxin family protein [Nannocystaceae bacterium]|nr:thioredoxin family protein [Nannocystaceae bacterium]
MKRTAIALSLVLVACSSSKSNESPAPAQAGATAKSGTPREGGGTATPTPVATSEPAAVGKAAPEFELTDADGKAHKLSDHKGKLVVLEWFNPGCPFVKYAHGEGPLKDMAAQEVEKGVVWLAINSGAPGKQGAGADNSREGAKTFGMSHPILVDESGAVGKIYGATKTPHVFLVDTEGVLVYAGAIDNAPIGEVDGGGAYVNYLASALADVRAGKPVATASTPSYGCSVKYKS